MLRRFAPFAVALLSATATATTTAAAAAQDSSATRGSFLLGIGRDMNVNRFADVGVALDAQLGYQRPIGKSRFSFRVSGDYSASAEGVTINGPDYLSATHSSQRTLDLALSLTYALTRSRIQPYLIAGVGAQHISRRSESLFATSTNTADPSAPYADPEQHRFSGRQWNPLFEGGVGVAARFRGVTLFSELRRAVTLESVFTDRRTLGIMPTPLTFGVRFD